VQVEKKNNFLSLFSPPAYINFLYMPEKRGGEGGGKKGGVRVVTSLKERGRCRVLPLQQHGGGRLKRARLFVILRFESHPNLFCFVLPFFYIYPLVGFKGQQYNIWLQAVSLLISDRSYSTARQLKLLSILSNFTDLLSGYTKP
jgi:hypothetical protein